MKHKINQYIQKTFPRSFCYDLLIDCKSMVEDRPALVVYYNRGTQAIFLSSINAKWEGETQKCSGETPPVTEHLLEQLLQSI